MFLYLLLCFYTKLCWDLMGNVKSSLKKKSKKLSVAMLKHYINLLQSLDNQTYILDIILAWFSLPVGESIYIHLFFNFLLQFLVLAIEKCNRKYELFIQPRTSLDSWLATIRISASINVVHFSSTYLS